MPLQDLTPQLRTRLNRMERAVGWFVLLSIFLLLFGFGYYLYNTAKSRGWFKVKTPYFTYAQSGNGFVVGDSVKLIGFSVGKITRIEPMPARGKESLHNVYVQIEVVEPYEGYIWTEGSVARWADQGLLGKRELDISRGTNGYGTYLRYSYRTNLTLEQMQKLPHLEKWHLAQEIFEGTNRVIKAWVPLNSSLFDKLTALGVTENLRALDTSERADHNTLVWNMQNHYYEPFLGTNIFELPVDEPPSLTERMQTMVAQVQSALPNFFQLTNQLASVLSNASRLTVSLDAVSENARPTLTNLNVITTRLRDPNGSLGEWLIPTNINSRLDLVLQRADGTLANVDTNLLSLNRSLDNLGNITSNLNNQVQANSNILLNISQLVVHSDQFVQGLKRFWLFRHLFRTPKPAKAASSRTAPPASGAPKSFFGSRQKTSSP